MYEEISILKEKTIDESIKLINQLSKILQGTPKFLKIFATAPKLRAIIYLNILRKLQKVNNNGSQIVISI